MNEEQADLLVDLYNLLWNLPRDHKFDIDDWYIGDRLPKEEMTEEKIVECGYSCCAVGWAITCLPSWTAAGFHWCDRGSPEFNRGGVFKSFYENAPSTLGVTEEEFDSMFMPMTGNETTTGVRKQIARVLDAHGWMLVDV